MRITYAGFESESQEAEARRAVEACVWVLPFWVHLLRVERGYSTEGRTVAEITCDNEYRMATVRIYGDWYDAPEQRRREMLLHEFAHAILDPLAQWMRGTVLGILKDSNPALYDVLRAEVTAKTEAVVQDLAFTFGRIGADEEGGAV